MIAFTCTFQMTNIIMYLCLNSRINKRVMFNVFDKLLFLYWVMINLSALKVDTNKNSDTIILFTQVMATHIDWYIS